VIAAIEQAAFAWGRLVGRYSLSVIRPERTVVGGREHFAARPCIWASWHRSNLIALSFWRQQFKRPSFTFVPPGLEGQTVRGWMTVFEQTPVLLPKDHSGNPQAALKQMARALRQGLDVIIALDGPHGPAETARPGALWLARLTGCPLIICGFAASPSVSLPRWDHHIVPLPGARLSAVACEPMLIGRDEPVDAAHLEALAERVHAANRLARRLLESEKPMQPTASPAARQPADATKGPR
jgi:lysophospholipid acyltransferase (LPLAT)-like uncharacterized protein